MREFEPKITFGILELAISFILNDRKIEHIHILVEFDELIEICGDAQPDEIRE